MKSRLLVLGWLVHFGLSLGGFLGLYGFAAGVQDAGTAVPGLGWLEVVLRFVLLQPLAHWALEAVSVAWWTWPGLGAVATVFALNSLAVVAAIGACLVALRRRRGQPVPR